MKNINWKVIIITSLLCLLPIIIGVSVYEKLPAEIPIHWNINNEPDSVANKSFFVFGFPVIMMGLQIFCCIINDINSSKKGRIPKFERVLKAIFPVLTIILYITTILWALGTELDIRRIACLLVGIIIILIGNYMPKIRYEDNKKLQKSLFLRTADVWNKVKRPFGYFYILAGILMIISIFFEPIISMIALIIFLVVAVSISAYAVILSNK